MSYKTILVHVDQSRHAPARMRLAARLAIAHDAHLIGAAVTGMSRFIYQDSGLDLARTIVATHVESIIRHANEALATFEQTAAALGVPSYEKRLIDDDAAGGIALQARYADLTVLSQTDADDPRARLISDLPQAVMLNSAQALLLVPYAGSFEHAFEQALVAWDESVEATRAVSQALPLLKRASKVTLAMFNSAGAGATDPSVAPGAEMAQFLARHGVNVDLLRQSTGIPIGDALLSLAADLRSDLIVMGGYGHTRLREMVLGGVTETVLRTMTVPVLISH
jgi:nucleotide-binding universal stress UspA family protein